VRRGDAKTPGFSGLLRRAAPSRREGEWGYACWPPRIEAPTRKTDVALSPSAHRRQGVVPDQAAHRVRQEE